MLHLLARPLQSAPMRKTLLLENREKRRCRWRGDIPAIPPAAAERLEQSCRVREAGGPGLHQADQRLLIGLLRIEQQQIIDVAELQPPPRDGEASQGGALGDDRFLQGDGVRSQRGQVSATF
jgi:hypothetical protein